MPRNPQLAASWLALLLPLALILGALGSQYIGGLHPCVMCHWQRWPHYGAIAIALLAFVVPERRARLALVGLAAIAILGSGVIGVYHAGVEYHLWPNYADCANNIGTGSLEDLMKAPIISCDKPQWKLFGISLAGFNAILSIGGAIAIFTLLKARPRP